MHLEHTTRLLVPDNYENALELVFEGIFIYGRGAVCPQQTAPIITSLKQKHQLKATSSLRARKGVAISWNQVRIPTLYREIATPLCGSQ